MILCQTNGKYSDEWVLFCLFVSDFQSENEPVHFVTFVPVYRCEAAPDLHRISYFATSSSRIEQKINHLHGKERRQIESSISEFMLAILRK